MGYREPEAEDPLEFRAVGVPGDPRLMVRTLVEEYALMGTKADRILALFRTPFFRGGHLLYTELGEEVIRDAIRTVFGGEVTPVAGAGMDRPVPTVPGEPRTASARSAAGAGPRG